MRLLLRIIFTVGFRARECRDGHSREPHLVVHWWRETGHYLGVLYRQHIGNATANLRYHDNRYSADDIQVAISL